MIKAWIVPHCDLWYDLELTKPKYSENAKQFEIDHDTYIIYKGLLMQFDKLQEKLYSIREKQK